MSHALDRTSVSDDSNSTAAKVSVRSWLARAAEIAPFLNAPAVQKLWQDVRADRASKRLAYTMLVLLLWLGRHRVEFPESSNHAESETCKSRCGVASCALPR